MTEAIEAGARALEPYIDNYNEVAKICIEAAIASGALVPASATKPYSSAEFLTSPEALDEYVKEKVASAVAEMRERCAKVGMFAASNKCSDLDGTRLTGHLVGPAVADAIRQLDLAPASGDYVVVPREPTQEMIEAGRGAIDPIDQNILYGKDEYYREIFKAMINATSSNGGEK